MYSTQQHRISTQSSQFQWGHLRLVSPILYPGKKNWWNVAPISSSVPGLWRKYGVFSECYDVAVTLTSDHLDMKCQLIVYASEFSHLAYELFRCGSQNIWPFTTKFWSVHPWIQVDVCVKSENTFTSVQGKGTYRQTQNITPGHIQRTSKYVLTSVRCSTDSTTWLLDHTCNRDM